MVIVGARPNVGKTAFGGTIALLNGVESVNPVGTLFISLDVSAQSIANRFMAGVAQIDITKIRSGNINQVEFARMIAHKDSFDNMYIVETSSGIKASGIKALVKQYVRDHGIGLVIVDYLQKIKPDGRHEKKTYEVGEVSGVLKDTALECDVAMVALCQLNRDAEEQDRMPQMRDLADSGQIERDADAIILLHRKRGDVDGPSKLIVAKQRDGEVGVIDAHFIGRYCRFYPVENRLETE
jgi:replicative DNA helicase